MDWFIQQISVKGLFGIILTCIYQFIIFSFCQHEGSEPSAFVDVHRGGSEAIPVLSEAMGSWGWCRYA